MSGGDRRGGRRAIPGGPGERADPAVRRRVESATGERLDHVRVHDDTAARGWVDEQGALGATLGPDVALGSQAGGGIVREAVLAHELAHAAQNRSVVGAPPTLDGPADRAQEAEADMVAAAALVGERAPVSQRSRRLRLQRCNGDPPPPKVKAAAEKTDPKKLAGFEQMVKGGVPAKDAAAKMQLPKELTDAMAEAWKNSFPGGKSKEQGGILVKKKDGSLAWVKATSSTSGSSSMPYSAVPTGATALAEAHTHPYDAGEGGHKGVMFSGGDLGGVVTMSAGVQVVHAGDRYFAVTKTKEFEDLVAAAPNKSTLETQINTEWSTAFAAAKGDLPARAREATTAICKKYNLALYEGTLDGSLSKVETK